MNVIAVMIGIIGLLFTGGQFLLNLLDHMRNKK